MKNISSELGELEIKYADLVLRPTLRTEDNCNLTQVLENYLDLRHPGHPEIGEVADKLTRKLCFKDCEKCSL